MADGLLPASTARERLEELARRMATLEPAADSTLMGVSELADPEGGLERLDDAAAREAVRLLFESVSLNHGSSKGRPRMDLSRLSLSWRNDLA